MKAFALPQYLVEPQYVEGYVAERQEQTTDASC